MPTFALATVEPLLATVRLPRSPAYTLLVETPQQVLPAAQAVGVPLTRAMLPFPATSWVPSYWRTPVRVMTAWLMS